MFIKKIVILLFLLFSFCTKAQLYFTENNSAKNNSVKVNSTEDIYDFPWTGGMNSCQFSEIDLNLDGIMDLFVFDRYGNRIMTFINGGTPDSVDYSYAPQYKEKFPKLYDWVILADYNADGKQDIFTYSNFGGILVYQNVSDGELKFESMVYPFLTSLQGTIYTNILVTYADYPAITDLDNDGDLDILTFWGMGAFVEMHKNLSMEKYGVPDSLDFEKTDNCWGHFAENEESNEITLDTCFGIKENIFSNNKDRHSGSTFLVIDLDGDDDKDLILGDVDYPNLMKLVNGGTSDDAYMISLDTAFLSIWQYSMPLATYVDINNDSKKDMLVSPFVPSMFNSRNYKSVILYQNSGENNYPVFHYKTDKFLQDEMIDVGSGAYPVFFDYDNDGLKDIVIGNYGYYNSSWYDPNGLILYSDFISKLALFKNTGTATDPSFMLMTRDFADISGLELTGVVPAFADLDGDGDDDMLIGNYEGNLYYYKNSALIGDTAEFVLEQINYQDINVGNFSAPQLIDLDKDGLTDLIIGEKKGNLNFYKNTGTHDEPVFTFVTDSLGKVNVTDYSVSYNGYSVPCFFQDNDDKYKLIVGSEQGKLFYFTDIDNNLDGKFTESDSLFQIIDSIPFSIDEGIRTAAAIADLNNDNYFDLLAGNFAGGLKYFSGIDSPPVSPGIIENNFSNLSFKIFPNPAKEEINISLKNLPDKGKIIMKIFDMTGRLMNFGSYRNIDLIKMNISKFEKGVYIVEISLSTDKLTGQGRKLLIIG
ncbi:MAG: T9SS type A sorting domain-containing protein [Bacteroidales bacterium]|nr:T9SS type A sorting domain-containing protein [Bacteroidales bacterium]